MMATGKAKCPSDLEAKSRELLKQSETLTAKSHALRGLDVEKVMINAIKTDMKVGLTFADIALHTRDQAKRQRNRAKARLAYETVMRCFKRLHPSDEDTAEIQSRGAELRAALEKLGESL